MFQSQRSIARQAVAVLATLLLALASKGYAGPGHDHAHEAASLSEGSPLPRIESATSQFELVATAEGHTLTIYLDRTETNEPVDHAVIEISGDGLKPVTAARTEPGLYTAEVDWADVPGTRPLVFMVTAGDTVDLLNGTLVVPGGGQGASTPAATAVWQRLSDPLLWGLAALAALAGFLLARLVRTRPAGMASLLVMLALSAADRVEAHGDEPHDDAPAAMSEMGRTPRRAADGSVFVPKITQRLLEVRTAIATVQDATATREMIGTVIPDPSSFGRVQAPLDGQIELTGRGIASAGQHVEAGDVLADLAPSIPVADLGTMQQLRAEVEGKLKIAEQKLARLSRISSVVAQSDIDDTRAELEALKEQRRVLAPKEAEKIALKAPVSGVISVANVRAGQVVSARDTLFEIVDPERLWVEAIAPEAHSVLEYKSGEARDVDGHDLQLTLVSRSPVLRHQSLPLLFRIEAPHEGLVIGAPVKVLADAGEAEKGIVLPEDAIVRAPNGLQQVWEKVSAERFEPRTVTVVPLYGGRTLIKAGLQPGARVVTRAAGLINQIR